MQLSSDLEALLQDGRVARLATVDEHNRPHVVPVCFVYQEGVAHIVLDAKPKRVPVTSLRRVRNLLANPVHYRDSRTDGIHAYSDPLLSRLAYVQLRGRARLLEAGPEQVEALTRLRAK